MLYLNTRAGGQPWRVHSMWILFPSNSLLFGSLLNSRTSIGVDFGGDAGDTSPSIFRTRAFVLPNKDMKKAFPP
uniref:Uncharacterized protein n=1 Tax=Anguilla anguilla TaxID=7936 RepID=A0A0E9SLN9_ANGAN